jgi:2-polyprenyl-6-methoxyphenol hydroxylase-like FAD-dependent oxidoreductase
MTSRARPFAVIAGGGPVGMVLALELGRRGIRCVLLNDKAGPTDRPKANATSPRSMETLRRLGVARGSARWACRPTTRPTSPISHAFPATSSHA